MADKIQLIQRDEKIQDYTHRTARKPRGLRHQAGITARRTLNTLPVRAATTPVTELAVKQNPLSAEIVRMHLPRILPASSSAKQQSSKVTHARQKRWLSGKAGNDGDGCEREIIRGGKRFSEGAKRLIRFQCRQHKRVEAKNRLMLISRRAGR